MDRPFPESIFDQCENLKAEDFPSYLRFERGMDYYWAEEKIRMLRPDETPSETIEAARFKTDVPDFEPMAVAFGNAEHMERVAQTLEKLKARFEHYRATDPREDLIHPFTD